ncbi:Similar to proteins involved in antibiotic biosynthesis, partial [Moritella viscosa]|uniref:condensation domain-containing protein n=1 Tax=Moritella viscosa TaxID=80854 RepID=UPI000918CC7E
MSVVDCVNSNEPSDWTGLSFSQQRLWLFQQLNPQSKAYNLGGLLWIDGELDVIKLESTIETVRQQQEILRAQFTEVDGIPCQRSVPYIYQKLAFINLEHHSEAVSEAQCLARELWLERFDLESGPLIRCCLYKVAENKHALLISGHHILVDAWSLQLVIKQIISGLSDKQLKVRKSQNYFSYAQEQRDWLVSSDAQSELADLHKSVNYDSARLTLPRLNELQQDTYTASHYCPEFSYELNDAVSCKAKQLGCSKFTLLLAGLQLTMNTWSSEGSPTLCVPNFNRNSANRRSLGFYVNNMALNTAFSPLMTTEEWIDLCKNNLDKAQKYQHLPLELLDNNEEQVNAQVAFNFRSHGDGLTQTSDELLIRFEEFEVSETPFEIVLDVISSEKLSCRFVYATELYSANVMKQFSHHYFKMIDLLCLPETITLAEIELFDDEERDTLNSFATQPHYWEYQPLPSLIQKQAELRPNAIALVHGDERLSYQALEHQANQLSHYLIEQGVSADMPVGVAFERGNTMLVAMLAVLKAGGAFLPLDPAYPNERLSFMLEDSGVDLLLTDSTLSAQVPCPNSIKSVYLDQQMMGSYSTDVPDVEFH